MCGGGGGGGGGGVAQTQRAQARNDHITTWLSPIYSPTSHVHPHATSHILLGAYFLSNSQGQTTEKYISLNMTPKHAAMQ